MLVAAHAQIPIQHNPWTTNVSNALPPPAAVLTTNSGISGSQLISNSVPVSALATNAIKAGSNIHVAYTGTNWTISTPSTNLTALQLQRISLAVTNPVNMPVIYSANPNIENLKPFYTNAPAVAYSLDGTGAVYGWSTNLYIWR